MGLRRLEPALSSTVRRLMFSPSAGSGGSAKPGPVTSSLLTGLQAYYEFDTLTFDSTGNGNTLTNNNVATQAAGIIGQAVSLLSSGTQFLSIASNASFQAGVGVRFTIAGWFKATTLPGLGLYVPIVAKWATAAAAAEYAVYFRNAAGVTNVAIEASNGVAGTELASTVTITSATWFFFCYRYDGVNLYITVNSTTTQVAYSSDVFAGTNPFQIGKDQTTSSFNGLIDQVGFWKVALTPTQVANLYGAGSPPAYPFTGVP